MTLAFPPISVPLHMDDTGTIRVCRTRITLDVILECHLAGQTVEQIHESFPDVPIAAIHAIVSYYLQHRNAVDGYLRDRQEQANALQAQVEATQGKTITRDQLLGRMQRKFR